MHSPELVLAFGISSWEWLVILLVALLLFGRRLPDVMRGLGSSVKEFKKGMDEVQAPIISTPPPAPPSGAVARESAPPPATPVAPATPPDAPPPSAPPQA